MSAQVKTKNILAYGIGDLYGGGAFLVIGTLFLIFLTDVVGLSPARAGLVLVIGKAWDAISDPLMGYISDHTRSKFGRRRPYFLFAIIPVALSFFALWFPVSLTTESGLFLYYLSAYVVFSTVFTMVMVPYSALNADMTDDYAIRTKLSGARMLFSQLSALISGVLPKIIVDASGYHVMGIVFGCLYALPWFFVFKGTWEMPLEEMTAEKEGLRHKLAGIRSVFHNRSFRIHLGMYICAYLAMDFLMALFAYFLTYYLGRSDLFPYTMLAILLTQILMLPVYIKISNQVGKGRAYTLGLAIWGTAMLLLFLQGPKSGTVLILTNCVLIGAGLSAGVMIPWAILPSITDVDEVMTLEKRTGIYAGMMTLIRKLAQALALWSVGYLLSLIGYAANQPQNPNTLLWLKMFFVLVPVLLIGTGILFAVRFKVTPHKQQILVGEIRRLRGGGRRKDADPAVIQVCEELTGVTYYSALSQDTQKTR